MKLTKIALACATVLCGTQAYAVSKTDLNTQSFTEILISGASAQQKTLGKIAEGMLQPGYKVFYDKPVTSSGAAIAGATTGKNFRSYFGQLAINVPGLNGGPTPSNMQIGDYVLIHNRALGGSVWGVNPVATNSPIGFMTVSSSCADVVSPAVTGPHYTCDVSTSGGNVTLGGTNRATNAGVSDVEPKMFQGINVAAGDSALTNTQREALSGGGSQYAVVFGPAVRKAGVTNLSRAQVNSILIGNYSDWSQVDPSLSGGITVCRRVNGSGTQAAYNAYFQGYGCSLSPQSPIDSSSANVIEGSTSGDVVNCLNTHDGSIGTLSLENVKKVGTDLWDFVNLDGIDPKLSTNVVSGAYPFSVEQTIQWVPGNVTDDKEAFLEEFKTRSGSPSVLSGLPGVYALPTVANPGDAGVVNGTRFGDTCAALQLVYPFAP